MGNPGAGKGYITTRLIKEHGDNYKLICAGDLLRAEKKSGSPLGKKIAKLIDSGNYVSDELITNIVYNEIKKEKSINKSFLLDGYPRTVKQAKSLEAMINPPIIIWLNVSDEVTIKRNLDRGVEFGRPDDSNIDLIKERLKIYKESTLPLKKHYSGRVINIDAERSKDEVYSDVLDILFETFKEPKNIFTAFV